MDLISQVVESHSDFPTRVDYPLSNLRVFIRRDTCSNQYRDSDDKSYMLVSALSYLAPTGEERVGT